MFRDPLTSWDGEFPYDALAVVGITPDSSDAQVRDASFELLSQRLMTPQVRVAWEELRRIERRLLIDFLLYDITLVDEIPAALAAIRQALDRVSEPPEVAAALAFPPDLLHGLVGELGLVTPFPTPDIEPMAEFGDVVPVGLVAAEIRADRWNPEEPPLVTT